MRTGVFAAMLFAMTLRGDVLYLLDGKHYTGTFVSGNRTWIHFTTDARARQSFRTRDVDRVVFRTEARASAGPQDASTSPAASLAERDVTPQPAPPARPAQIPATAEAAMNPPFPLATRQSELGTNGPPDAGAIDAAYTSLGGSTSVLGIALSVEKWAPDHRAVVRAFQNGDIYWTEQGGAHAIRGPLRAAWLEAGGAARLGYPISDEDDAGGGFSRMQQFERGSITWTESDGAKVTYSGAGR